MTEKIKIGKGGKVNIKWKVLSIDYSHEAEDNIKAKFAAKYGISKEHITVEPIFISKDKDGNVVEFTNEIIYDVQNPKFQQSLFKPYLEERDIQNYDFDKLIEIDNQVNSNINYEVYEKSRQYTIKWIKWSNFMSYGDNNFVDFTNFKGIVHLCSNPANQGGKTAFSLDLLRFLLFGKVTSRQDDWTLAKAFNDFRPEATEVVVEGCINIDGVDYIVKRTLTRPALNKRTEKSKVTQKIQYYKLVGDKYIDLVDSEDQEGCTGTETNKIIKESLGNERDFDLMICVSADNLKELISLKDTDRGRLISRWIGLLPLEEKDKIAREMFNKSVSPKLTMNRYNKEELKQEIEVLTADNERLSKEIKELEIRKTESEKRLVDYNTQRDTLIQSTQKVDEKLTKVDVTTLETTLQHLVADGNKKKAEYEVNRQKYEEVKDVTFDEEHYKAQIAEDKRLAVAMSNSKNEILRLRAEIDALKKGEYCPTCGAKLAIDNSEAINNKTQRYTEASNEWKELDKQSKKIAEEIQSLNEQREVYNESKRLDLLCAKNMVDLENLRTQYKENDRLLKDIQANKEAISNNNKIEIAINNINVNIKTEDSILRDIVERYNNDIFEEKNNHKTIEECQKLIAQIEEDEKLVYNWRVYLDMVGKNGISKMLVRNVLPIINGKLEHFLSDVCDFRVEVVIDEHNDVAFNKIKDNVVSNLGSGSGFEKTVASLALRTVLSEISSFSKPSFVVFDEVLGGVAAVNYEQVKNLYDKIAANYAFIFHISHIEAIRDWGTTTVMVTKEKNISKIEVC